MRTTSRFAAIALTVSFFLLRSPSAAALTFSFSGGNAVIGGNASLTVTSTRISLSDFFDQYGETNWEIASAEETSGGGVSVHYYWDFGDTPGWDSYGALIDVPFQILSESGDLTPKPVTLEFWGASYYEAQHINTCCFSDAPTVTLWGAPGEPSYSATQNLYDVFSGTYTLLTNTNYALTYFHTQYVEGTPSSNYLPSFFSSWDAYNTFVATNGTSGTVSASAFGFFDYNLSLVPEGVPEPGTLALLGLGLAGLGFARRRKTA